MLLAGLSQNHTKGCGGNVDSGVPVIGNAPVLKSLARKKRLHLLFSAQKLEAKYRFMHQSWHGDLMPCCQLLLGMSISKPDPCKDW